MLRIMLSYCFKSSHPYDLIFKFTFEKGNKRLLGYFFCFFVQLFTFLHIFKEHFSENGWYPAYVFDNWFKICKCYAIFLKCFFNRLFNLLLLFLGYWLTSWKIKLGNVLPRHFFFDLWFNKGLCRRFLRNSLVCTANRRARTTLLFFRLFVRVKIQATIFQQTTHCACVSL